MKLIIQSPLEYFTIEFSAESVLCQSEMAVIPKDNQQAIFNLLERQGDVNPRLTPSPCENRASPKVVKEIFEMLGYEVLTCPSYDQIERKETDEEEEAIRNYKPEGIVGIDYPSDEGLMMD